MIWEEDGKSLYFVPMRLQFFADEGGADKTEEATPKKLSDARKEGQVARSQELSTAVMLLAFFVVIKVFVGYIGTRFLGCFKEAYQVIDVYAIDEFGPAMAAAFLRDGLVEILIICLPILAVAVVVAFTVTIAQVKWQVTTKPLQPKLSKFNPINGFKRIFSKEKLFELIKDVVKIVLIFYVAYSDLEEAAGAVVSLYDFSLEQAIVYVGDFVIDLGIKISAIYLIIGFADYIYQKLKFKKDLMMSKQEVKDEYKQQEGDPQVKGRIKSKMREASQRRMMQKLPEADVVITNPTHFACAIKYDKEVSEAPILIAKGADYVAQKIKDAAKEYNIPIVENKPLARMLYYNVDLDSEIPRELYQMTAEVLAYVYKLKNGGAA
ncbi:MAG: flagellar biosynthesis protein FlhB [Lachnospiraceae bacterium]|nr:flagellar biosynthesis protein FlhB [Lachnospiraceae bacterium]